MGNKNLIPNSDRTPEELRAMTTKGGIQSGIARRKKRDLKKRIAATWELATEMKKKGFNRDIESLLKSSSPDKDIEVELLKDKIKVLGAGGIEMLTLMEIIDNPKISALARVTAIQNLLEHEFGKAQANDTLKLDWGSGIKESAAFSNDSIILGIQHGLVKLSLADLNKVTTMVNEEKEKRGTINNN